MHKESFKVNAEGIRALVWRRKRIGKKSLESRLVEKLSYNVSDCSISKGMKHTSKSSSMLFWKVSTNPPCFLPYLSSVLVQKKATLYSQLSRHFPSLKQLQQHQPPTHHTQPGSTSS